ncbi:MAG: hypothetical protein U5L02_16605 [Rheinheimera sp.]|nr:hypothetical protein [Rheinheimera sp.]
MPYTPIPVPAVQFATSDRGGVYMAKLNAIAAGVDAAINGANSQMAAANDASIFAGNAQTSATTATNQATKAGDWAEKSVDVIVETGKYSAKHHATKAALSATTAGGHVTTASGHVTTAASHANKAGDWAERAEDVLVEAGKYSAKHHAAKAAASATTAGGHVGTAAGHVTTASNHATKAGDWAEKAEDSLVEAGKYSAKHHAAKAAASASTAGGHVTTAAGHVSAAQQWASANENVVVASGKYSANHYALKAEYWAQQAAAATTGAMVFIGAYNASSNTWPAGAVAGYTYRISTAGTLGPFADSVTRPVMPGDIIIKRSDGQWDHVDAQDSDVVKTSRTVNGYALSANITLGFTDFAGTAAVAQIPNLPASKITSGTLPITYGGTGRSDGKAVALATARTINGVSFDGSANITLTPGNVGAMPLAGTQVTDWNTAVENGPYYSVSGATNVPKAAAGWQGFVSKLNSENIRQLIWSADGPAVELYSRCGDGTTLTWGPWSCLRHSEDGVDATQLLTAAGTINRKGVVTRAAIASASSFSVALAASGYVASDRVELSIAAATGAVVTLTATQSMGVTGGTAGTSHTVTGPVHISVVAVFNGTTWQLFVS